MSKNEKILQEKLKKRAVQTGQEHKSRLSFFPAGVKTEYNTVVKENKNMHNMIEEIRKRNNDHELRK